MSEIPIFFQRDDQCLFGVLHESQPQPGRGAFVLSHPFGEEKLWSHRVFVSLARQLATNGYTVLRFDYAGAGDSSGQSSTCSLDTYIADLSAAHDQLARRVDAPWIGLIGLRLGATIAALMAEQGAGSAEAFGRLHSAPLILCDPMTDGDAYLQELLRINLATQLAVYGSVREGRDSLRERLTRGESVNVEGYDIGPAFEQSIGTPALLGSAPKSHAGPVLVLALAANEKQPVRPALAELAGSYTRGSVQRVIEAPFWRETRQFCSRADGMQREIVDWLGRSDG